MGFTQSVGGLKSKSRDFLEKTKFCLTRQLLPEFPSGWPLPNGSRLACLLNDISQFIEINHTSVLLVLFL